MVGQVTHPLRTAALHRHQGDTEESFSYISSDLRRPDLEGHRFTEVPWARYHSNARKPAEHNVITLPLFSCMYNNQPDVTAEKWYLNVYFLYFSNGNVAPNTLYLHA